MKGIAITDDDIKIGGIGEDSEQLTEVTEEIKQTDGEEEEGNKESDNVQDNLTIDEVEVSGLSKSDGHIDRIERNKENPMISQERKNLMKPHQKNLHQNKNYKQKKRRKINLKRKIRIKLRICLRVR